MMNHSNSPESQKFFKEIAQALINQDINKVVSIIDSSPDDQVGLSGSDLTEQEWRMEVDQAIRRKRTNIYNLRHSFGSIPCWLLYCEKN
jgi:hypothetical protein